MNGLAEKYLGVALCKLSECDAVKIVLRLIYAVALALVLQVLILTYVAYKLS
jgi:hypothetical protein